MRKVILIWERDTNRGGNNPITLPQNETTTSFCGNKQSQPVMYHTGFNEKNFKTHDKNLPEVGGWGKFLHQYSGQADLEPQWPQTGTYIGLLQA